MKPLTRVTRPTLDVLQAMLDTTEPTWGLLLVKATGRPAGTVYPILARLEEHGWVEGHWEESEVRRGPRRRLYSLSTDGAAEAARLVAVKPVPRGIPRMRPVSFGVAL